MISSKFSHFDKVFGCHFWTKCPFRHREMIGQAKIWRASSKKRLFSLQVWCMHLFFYRFFQRFLFHTLLKPLKMMMNAPSLYRRRYHVLTACLNWYWYSCLFHFPLCFHGVSLVQHSSTIYIDWILNKWKWYKMIFHCSLMTFSQPTLPTTNCYYLMISRILGRFGKPQNYIPNFQLPHVPSSPFHQGAALRLPDYVKGQSQSIFVLQWIIETIITKTR